MREFSMNKTLLLAGAAAFLFAANANAMETKPYVGLDYNYSSFDIAHNAQRIEDDYHNASIVAGSKFGHNFGVEAFYQRSLNDTRNLAGQKYTSRIQAYGADLLGYLPLGCEQKVELIAGVGLGEYEMKVREVGYGSDKEEGLGYRFNVGAQYNITNDVAVRAMYRHVVLEHSDLDRLNEYSLGVRYAF